MTLSELRGLLGDCLVLWESDWRIETEADGLALVAGAGRFALRAAPEDHRPVRWVLDLPDGRRRLLPSITAALTTLRNATRDAAA